MHWREISTKFLGASQAVVTQFMVNIVFLGKPPFRFAGHFLGFRIWPENCMRNIQETEEDEIQLTLGEGGGLKNGLKNVDATPWERKVSYGA